MSRSFVPFFLQRALYVFSSAVIVAFSVPHTVFAAMNTSFLSTNRIVWYNSSVCISGGSSQADLSSASPGSGAPNGLTYPNLDAQKMVEAIEKYIEAKRPESPMKGTAQKAVVSGKQANINPFLAYAHAMKESELATTTVAGAQKKVNEGHNAFGRMATESQPHVEEGGAGRYWYKWTSFEASVDVNAQENQGRDSGDWFSYDRSVFSSEIDQGLSAYANRYAPPNENDTNEYIEFMQAQLDEMAGYAGSTTGNSSTTNNQSQTQKAAANCCASPTNGGGVVEAKGDNVETALSYLMSAGNGQKLNLAQAAGVIGNLQQESGQNLDPRASNGTHHGIAQWDASDRWGNGVVKFAADMGGDPYDLSIQLRYLAWEMGLTNEWQNHTPGRGGVANALRGASTAADATKIFEEQFEGSGGSALDKRQANAEALYNKYVDSPALGNNKASDKGSAAACNTGGSNGNGSIQQLVTKYAWPELPSTQRHGTDKKPDYANAVQTAQGEGRYIGSFEGVDCGGFVTTLLYDSGFDKTYNNDAKGGYASDGRGTTFQRQWAEQNWQRLGSANGTYEPDGSKFTDDKLQPGDVAFVSGHTWVYVGDVEGFQSKYASASQGEKAPSAAGEGFDYNGAVWYRKKGGNTT